MRVFSCTRSFTFLVLSVFTFHCSYTLSTDSQAAAILEPRLDGGAIASGAGTWLNSTFTASTSLTATRASSTATEVLSGPSTTRHLSIYLTKTLPGGPPNNSTTLPSQVISSVSSGALSSAGSSPKGRKCKPSTGITNPTSRLAVQSSDASAVEQAPVAAAASTPARPPVDTMVPGTNEDVALGPVAGSAAPAAGSSVQNANENTESGSAAAASGTPAVCGSPTTVTVTTESTVTVTVTVEAVNSPAASSEVTAPAAMSSSAVAAPAAIITGGEAAPAAMTSGAGAAPAAVTSGAVAAPAATTGGVVASKSYKTTCKHRTKRRSLSGAVAASSSFAQNVEATAAASAIASAGGGGLPGSDIPSNVVEKAANLGGMPGTSAPEAAAQSSSPTWQSSMGAVSSQATTTSSSSYATMPASTQGSSSHEAATWSSGSAWQTSVGVTSSQASTTAPSSNPVMPASVSTSNYTIMPNNSHTTSTTASDGTRAAM